MRHRRSQVATLPPAGESRRVRAAPCKGGRPEEAMSESPAPAAASPYVVRPHRPAPRAWLLLGQRAGDRAQVEAIGAALAALGWSCEPKRIVANGLFRIPNLLLGASLLSIDRRGSDALTPPWPDLVIAAGRRSVPAALWIRRQARGRA